MKSLFVLIAALVSASTFAAPKIGDTATYAGTQAGMALEVTTTILAFNAAAGKYTVKTDMMVAGQRNSSTEEQPADEIVDVEMGRELVANCAEAGGTVASVTVRAGTFQTCNLQGMYIGAVPFGLVKGDMGGIQFELVSFRSGN